MTILWRLKTGIGQIFFDTESRAAHSANSFKYSIKIRFEMIYFAIIKKTVIMIIFMLLMKINCGSLSKKVIAKISSKNVRNHCVIMIVIFIITNYFRKNVDLCKSKAVVYR